MSDARPSPVALKHLTAENVVATMPEFRKQFYAYLSARGRRLAPPIGQLGTVLTAAEYLAFTGQENPFAPPADPGPLAHDANPAARDIHTTARKNWTAWSQLVEEALQVWHEHVPQELYHQICHAQAGPAMLTLAQMWTQLNANYGAMPPAMLAQLMDSLAAQAPPETSLESILAQHLHVHTLKAASGHAMSDPDKVSALCKCLAGRRSLRDGMKNYFRDHPQAQTYLGLSAALLAEHHANLHFAPPPTAPRALVAVSEISEGGNDDPVPTMGELQRQIKELANLITSKSFAPASSKSYCWTHGHCGHASAACSQPKAGHRKEATADKQLGGCSSVYSQRKRDKPKN